MISVDKYPLIYIMTELPMYHPAVFAEQYLYDWGLYYERRFDTIYYTMQETFNGYPLEFLSFDEMTVTFEHPGFDDIIRVKEYSEDEAYVLISEYLELYDEAYPSDLSHYLQMDYELVHQIVREIEGERKVKEFLRGLKDKGETECDFLQIASLLSDGHCIELEDQDLAEKILKRLRKKDVKPDS